MSEADNRMEELADRVERASSIEQRSMLEQVFSAIHPGLQLPAPGAYWPPQLTRFVTMLDAEAFESAAMSLVPEGWFVNSITEYNQRTWDATLRGPWTGETRGYVGARTDKSVGIATPALALTAASLRARALTDPRP